ncbi:MAG: hypothetical protein KF878_27825 [Planctomycetes bacterium]|nr:hypothetical protein [Planctomycetota bacterium]
MAEAAVGDFIDPWGRRMVRTGEGLIYSVGRNGVDEGGAGDDVRPATGPRLSLYESSTYLLVFILLFSLTTAWNVFVVPRRPTWFGEAVVCAAAATQLTLVAVVVVEAFHMGGCTRWLDRAEALLGISVYAQVGLFAPALGAAASWLLRCRLQPAAERSHLGFA